MQGRPKCLVSNNFILIVKKYHSPAFFVANSWTISFTMMQPMIFSQMYTNDDINIMKSNNSLLSKLLFQWKKSLKGKFLMTSAISRWIAIKNASIRNYFYSTANARFHAFIPGHQLCCEDRAPKIALITFPMTIKKWILHDKYEFRNLYRCRE